MAATLPVIDISPLYSGSTEDRRKVALELDQACRTWGFFYITGHGIGPERIKTLMEMSARFFALPQEEKLKIDITKSANHRGYGLYEAEQLDPSQPTDWKETFDMGLHLDSDHPSVKAGRKLRGPNRHPTALPGWTELLEKHYVDMQAVAMLMLQALALAIGTDESFFVDKFHEQLSVFRMIHYPALPQEKGRVVCGAHTDYGIITMLYQDPAGGLQVQNLEGEWMDAPYLPNSFVVNIGDMMAMWSNDRYKSTKHRVLNPGIERYSMPFFTEPNPDTIISCLPNCCDDAHPAKYPDVSVEDWMQKRFAETYAYERVGAKNASA